MVGHSRRVTDLMELPQRFDARMNALDALEQLATHARMIHVPVLQNGVSHSDRSFGVIGRLADPPLSLPVSNVTGN